MLLCRDRRCKNKGGQNSVRRIVVKWNDIVKSTGSTWLRGRPFAADLDAMTPSPRVVCVFGTVNGRVITNTICTSMSPAGSHRETAPKWRSLSNYGGYDALDVVLKRALRQVDEQSLKDIRVGEKQENKKRAPRKRQASSKPTTSGTSKRREGAKVAE
jgi:hypothetical protein